MLIAETCCDIWLSELPALKSSDSYHRRRIGRSRQPTNAERRAPLIRLPLALRRRATLGPHTHHIATSLSPRQQKSPHPPRAVPRVWPRAHTQRAAPRPTASARRCPSSPGGPTAPLPCSIAAVQAAPPLPTTAFAPPRCSWQSLLGIAARIVRRAPPSKLSRCRCSRQPKLSYSRVPSFSTDVQGSCEGNWLRDGKAPAPHFGTSVSFVNFTRAASARAPAAGISKLMHALALFVPWSCLVGGVHPQSSKL